jgi:hypothetical protein
VLYLVGVSAAAWLLAALPARHLGGGDPAVVHSGTALLLCLLPAAATLLWAGWAGRHSPEQQLLMVLGGTGVRMGVVLGAALALTSLVPYYHHQGFWLWLLLFYLLTLALEVVLVVKGNPASGEH